MGTGWNMYAGANDDMTIPSILSVGGSDTNIFLWYIAVQNALGVGFKEQIGAQGHPSIASDSISVYRSPAVVCPSSVPGQAPSVLRLTGGACHVVTDYMYNAWMNPRPNHWWATQGVYAKKISQITRNASRTMVFWEAWRSAHNRYSTPAQKYSILAEGWAWDSSHYNPAAFACHRQFMNQLFSDGHVEANDFFWVDADTDKNKGGDQFNVFAADKIKKRRE